mmetsp:Transcript_11472/g.20277  ORF Transcript_11472/g.20277 Transcript_11472/m.20277 type:complete len:471 (-) Transcript_11472:238-1650(-)|eukprot:CAMPEP_0197643644 /NCGR_PEP_ID=MMETSP1338-20131121/16884_1 /TAXON_ID=43686 ORGANISM="Pelagodinium beii, Strain RCC1491" /NCGR_SAMPLE_ID=MMETSP1338 /ASSEMBLY_ACC=CAM_ASM_000754 /LENGTH=470 /DNA_ID=CAMNT_0043216919 /DNA_START=71 /DNA_END=1483 /DNA_ORIENTATION=+
MVLDAHLIHIAFGIAIAITTLVEVIARSTQKSSDQGEKDVDFARFQRHYLVVYLVAMFADWLQGPYVYALYASYGYSDGDNARLFVAGFGSSMIVGTFIGSMADRIGRRKSALLYCVLYIGSCATKHVSSYYILMVGRVLGGVATSLLFSVFDSWMVCEHNKRGFKPELLGSTFGLAIFGNSLVAVAAGTVSQFAADFMPLSPEPSDSPQFHVGGYTGPFDVSSLCLLVCAAMLQVFWTENHGEVSGASGKSSLESMHSAFQLIMAHADIRNLGIVCSLFEASMFIFVFKWTPLVTDPTGAPPPYGTIFSTFMVSCMLGSRIFSFLTQLLPVSKVGQGLLVLALLSHALPVLAEGNYTMCFFSFLLFEMCVGMYFPMIGTLKGSVVPEGLRSTIYNLYRVPLNLIVVSALLVKIDSQLAFILTSFLLVCALVAQSYLTRSLESTGKLYAAVSTENKEEIEATTMGGGESV